MEVPGPLTAEIRALSHMRVAHPGPQGIPMVHDCAMTWPTPPGQYDAARQHADLPEQLLELWAVTDGMVLFADVLYGQEGLRLLGVQEAAVATVALAGEWVEADRGPLTEALFVFGRFIGDGGRLALHRETGEIVYVPEILALDECEVVAPSLREFLTAYRSFAGERYWDHHANRRLTAALEACGPYDRGQAR